jgi:UDP-glucose 4-epimerase
VNGLITELEAASGIDFPVKHAEARAGEVGRISLDVRLAGKVLGWAPSVFLAKGIKTTWEWFKAGYSGAKRG